MRYKDKLPRQSTQILHCNKNLFRNWVSGLPAIAKIREMKRCAWETFSSPMSFQLTCRITLLFGASVVAKADIVVFDMVGDQNSVSKT